MENLIEEIESLEVQHCNVMSKLSNIINELKREDCKKKGSEVKIDELKECIEFYTAQTSKFSKRLRFGKKIYSQFELATTCYKRVIDNNREKLEQQDCFEHSKGVNIIEANYNSQEIQLRYKKINENAEIINNLLNNLKKIHNK